MKNLQLGKVLMTAGIASYIDEANFHKEVNGICRRTPKSRLTRLLSL